MWVWKVRDLEGLPGGLLQVLHDGDGALALSDHDRHIDVPNTYTYTSGLVVPERGFGSTREGVW
jgi:hypothetical protein